MLYSYIPAYTHKYLPFYKHLPKGRKCSVFIFVLGFLYFLLLPPQHYNTSTLCNQCSLSATPSPCLKANCLQKPSAMWAAQSVSELLRNRLRMQRKYWMHLTGQSSSTRTGRRSRCLRVSCLRHHPAYPLFDCLSSCFSFLLQYFPWDKGKSLITSWTRCSLQKSNPVFVAVTPEAKALMEQILASNGSKEEIASRVEALLAGSELSSSRGMNGGFDGSKYYKSFVLSTRIQWKDAKNINICLNMLLSDKREHIPVSGPSRKAYIMLDESYEATVPNAGSSAPRRQGSWREKEVQRRKNHNLGLAQHLGRRRQSWMSGGQHFVAARCTICIRRWNWHNLNEWIHSEIEKISWAWMDGLQSCQNNLLIFRKWRAV